MTGVVDHLPEPLQAFSGLAEAVAPALRNLEAIYARYLELKDAGRILANSVEALRVELTYHSNAIEGSTLSLRETQLVIEGYAPTSGKTLREIYEARNHDRALRELEQRVEKRPLPSAAHGARHFGCSRATCSPISPPSLPDVFVPTAC